MMVSKMIRLSCFAFVIMGCGCLGDEPDSPTATDDAVRIDAEKAGAVESKDGQASEQEVPADYRVTLESGRVIDVGEIFRPHIKSMRSSLQDQMRRPNSPSVRLNYEESRQPLLIAGRRGKVLHGTFGSFAESGPPVAYVAYQRGERSGSVLTWDEAHRPLVFSQYVDGELDGIRCMFRGCCETCTDGHVWFIEEWDRGELRSAHLASGDGKATTFLIQDGQPYEASSDDLKLAMTELKKFEKRFDQDESKLKFMIQRRYEYDKLASAERIRLQNEQRRYGMMSGLRSARFPSFSSPGGTAHL